MTLATAVRALALTFSYLFAVVSLGSVLAWLLAGTLDIAYPKILSRSVLLFAALGLLPLWRLAGLNATTIGLAPLRGRHVVLAFALGVAVVLPLMLFFVVVEYRVLDDRVDYAGAEFWRFIVVAATSGLLVGVFEETLFRGLLFGAARRSMSFAAASCLVAVLYAAVHFVNRGESAAGDVAWYSGYAYASAALTGFADPVSYADSFLALFLLGVLFCLVRERHGLWWCIGLHAAWVFAIRVYKNVTIRDIDNPYQALVGSYDHFVGLLVAVWLVFIFVVLILYRETNPR